MRRDRLIDGMLALGGLAAIFGLAWHHMAIVGDGFWYIASGRWVLAHHTVPHVDPFAYAGSGSWTLVNSAACVLFALVTNTSGLHGLMRMGAVLEALAVGTLWLGATRTRHARLLLLGVALTFIQVDAQDLSCRGQLFGDLGFVLLLAAFARLRDGKRVHPALVFVGAVLWTNLHLSFLTVVVAPIGVAALLFLEPRASRPRIAPFLAFAGISAVATLVNPYGPAYLRVIFGLAFDPSTATYDLFRSPDFHDPGWLFAPGLGLAAVLLRERFGAERMRRPEQALLLVFVAMACMARRYATEAIAVDLAIVGPILDRLDLRLPRLLPAASVVAASVAGVAGLDGWLERDDPERDVPAEAARVAREASRAKVAQRSAFAQVLNPFHWGGYLAYEWMGDPRYWVDGRDHVFLFGNGTADDHARLWTGNFTSLDLLDDYEAGVVLWERGSTLDAALRANPAWRLIHVDRIAVVYVRVDHPPQPGAREPAAVPGPDHG
jgi:hypothetical protein